MASPLMVWGGMRASAVEAGQVIELTATRPGVPAALSSTDWRMAPGTAGAMLGVRLSGGAAARRISNG
jgi:hypothetical protein